MSKYKEGDKFIIELGTSQKGTGNMIYHKINGANTYLTERELNRLVNVDDILQRLEQERTEDVTTITYEHDIYHDGYREGLSKAIEIVKGGVSNETD